MRKYPVYKRVERKPPRPSNAPWVVLALLSVAVCYEVGRMPEPAEPSELTKLIIKSEREAEAYHAKETKPERHAKTVVLKTANLNKQAAMLYLYGSEAETEANKNYITETKF